MSLKKNEPEAESPIASGTSTKKPFNLKEFADKAARDCVEALRKAHPAPQSESPPLPPLPKSVQFPAPPPQEPHMWELNEHQKRLKELYPEPQLKDFPNEEAYLEARSGHRHMLGPLLRPRPSPVPQSKTQAVAPILSPQRVREAESEADPPSQTGSDPGRVLVARTFDSAPKNVVRRRERCVTPRSHSKTWPSATISKEWGYEIHSITLTSRNWRIVKSGQGLKIRGKGYWADGDHFWDYWTFNSTPDESLLVEYGDDGATGFRGQMDAADIEEHF